MTRVAKGDLVLERQAFSGVTLLTLGRVIDDDHATGNFQMVNLQVKGRIKENVVALSDTFFPVRDGIVRLPPGVYNRVDLEFFAGGEVSALDCPGVTIKNTLTCRRRRSITTLAGFPRCETLDCTDTGVTSLAECPAVETLHVGPHIRSFRRGPPLKQLYVQYNENALPTKPFSIDLLRYATVASKNVVAADGPKLHVLRSAGPVFRTKLRLVAEGYAAFAAL